jgi:transcriptional regulator with XRE-family HTH domain
MGRSRRKKPDRLPEKLLTIRKELGLSQSELVTRLESSDYPLYKGDVSNFELGKSEPPLVILLRYARLANVILDTLADDEVDLPRTISVPK